MSGLYKDFSTKTCIAAVLAVLALPAVAATNNGCDNENNDRINPEIALCSTHVYNIGETTNPASESDKQLMRNVVALKTTVMTQQMYKQYEYLETMIRRFKTQLEKAVLTTKLQAAGADSSSAGSTSYSGVGTSSSGAINRNSYAVIDGASDCNLVMDKLEALQCVQGNLSVVLSAINNRKVSEAGNQLKKDVEVLKAWDITPTGCNYISGESTVKTCFQNVRTKVATEIDKYKQKNRQNALTGITQQQG